MPDIAIVWDTLNMRGDWAVSAGDLATGDDLETCVAVMLFTDRVLPQNDPMPAGMNDIRGWPGDTYNDQPIGSLLWTLRRVSISGASNTLQDVKNICENALASLRTDGVAKTINVNASYLGRGTIGIVVQITKPDGSVSNFKYQWAWTT